MLEEEMHRRSVRDMEARQQCFKGECEIRQLKKEMRRDKILLKELEQQISVLKSKGNHNSLFLSEEVYYEQFFIHTINNIYNIYIFFFSFASLLNKMFISISLLRII